jgi:hypothetical protein
MDLDTGAPFPGNQIPASRISPISTKLAAFWPTPNFGAAQFDGANNYLGVSRNSDNDDQYFVRVDHNFNDKNRLFGRYGIQTVNLPVFPHQPASRTSSTAVPGASRTPR